MASLASAWTSTAPDLMDLGARALFELQDGDRHLGVVVCANAEAVMSGQVQVRRLGFREPGGGVYDASECIAWQLLS